MSTPDDPAPRPRRWRRRLLIAAAALVVAAVAAVLAFPFALSTPRARRWLLDRANAALAPNGRLEVASFRFSWFAPTRMTGFVLRDAQGEAVLSAPTVHWDRSLGPILLDRPRYGRLTLRGGAVDVERRPDGSIDLLEALAPILGPDPKADWTLHLVGTRVRVRTPELRQPLTSAHGEITIRRPAAPRPLSWDVRLQDGPTEAPPRLLLAGSFNRWTATASRPGDITLSLSSRGLPIALDRPEGALSGTVTTTLQANRDAGRWASRGDASWRAFRLAVSEDVNIALDTFTLGWDAAQNPDGWDITSLNFQSDAANLTAHGTTRGEGFTTHIDGDLAPGKLRDPLAPRSAAPPLGLNIDSSRVRIAADLSREAPTAPGIATAFTTQPAPEPSPLRLEGRIDLEGFSREHDGETTPLPALSATLRGTYESAEHALALDGLTLLAPQGTLRLAGRLDDLPGTRRLDVRGTFDPDPQALRDALAGRLSDQIDFEIGPLAFQLRGPLAEDDPWTALAADLDVPLQKAGAFGMELGPTHLAAHFDRNRVTLDPIRTTLNGGRVEARPEIVADESWSNVLLRFAPGSSIDGAEVNDEVSSRVLAYVVPTLADATRVRGTVAVAIDRAEFPLAGEGRSIVEGNMVFDDVVFTAGPLADELLGFTAAPGAPRPSLRLSQPVLLSVHDGRVYQRGLAVPLGQLASIQMEGSVDFEKNLDLEVTIPLSTDRLESRPVLALIAGGVRPTIPIRGTLDRPRVDAEALGRNMGRMGLDIAERAGLGFGASLLERMSRPRTPEEQAQIDARRAQQDLERQERKALQEQKRMQRRMRRGR